LLIVIVRLFDYYFETILIKRNLISCSIEKINSEKECCLQAADWSMKFVPIWGDILSDMILLDEAMSTSSKYAPYMEYFSLSRPNRLIEEITITNKGFQTKSIYFLTLVLSFHTTFY